MSVDDVLRSHERALHQLLDAQVVAAGRAKADALVIRKLVDALSVSGLLDRGPFEQVLIEALRAAREVPTKDAVAAALWVSFADRIADIMGDAAPPKAKGM
jgi:hypothetical protein